MIGCDLHDRNMLLRYAVGTSEPQQLAYDNDASGRRRMITRLKSLAQKQNGHRLGSSLLTKPLGWDTAERSTPRRRHRVLRAQPHASAQNAQECQAEDRRQRTLRCCSSNCVDLSWRATTCRSSGRRRSDCATIENWCEPASTSADELTRVKLKITFAVQSYEIKIKIISPTTSKVGRKLFVAWIARERCDPNAGPDVGVKLKLLLDRFEMYRVNKPNWTRH